jgi:hypothetical protein
MVMMYDDTLTRNKIYRDMAKSQEAGHMWLTSIILAIQEAEIRRTAIQSKPRQTVCKILSPKTHHIHTQKKG